MKKSRLSGLFAEESSSLDKTLLTYHGPQQLGSGRASADSPPPPASNSPSSLSIKDSQDMENSSVTDNSQESSGLVSGKGMPPSSGSTISTTDAGGAPELLHSCIVSVFTFSGSESVSLGSLGCALYWEPSRHRSLLVLYRSRQQQICLLTLRPASLPAVQPQLYVSFQCDAGRQFSIHLASLSALREFVMKVLLAATLTSVGGPPVSLSLPTEAGSSSGGRRARDGDSLHLEVTEWAVQKSRSDSLRQRGGPNPVTGALDSSWRAALRGARPGERWLVGDPASPELLREVHVLAVRPPPRQPPLRLPAEDGVHWRLGDDAATPSPESPPSPPSSPSLPEAGSVDQTMTGTRAIAEEDFGPRDVLEEDEDTRTASASSKGRADVLARMARLGQQMFPSMAGRGRTPSPPPSPLPSPTRQSPSPLTQDTTVAPTAEEAGKEESKTEPVGGRKSAGVKPKASSRRSPGRLPPQRPPVAPRPDSAELCVLFGRLEAKLETVLSRLEIPAGGCADAETLATGVRQLAAENAALREAARQADRGVELRLEAERSRAAMAAELADALAELTEARRKLAETQRRLAAAEEAAAAAAGREEELKTQLAAAKPPPAAAAAAGKGSQDAAEPARAAWETRKMLKGVYKTLRSRLPPEATFTGAEVGAIVAEVVRETLQRVETEADSSRMEAQAGNDETGSGRTAVPPFVTEGECIEKGDD